MRGIGMRALVTGSTGLLGYALVRDAKSSAAVTTPQLDVLGPTSLGSRPSVLDAISVDPHGTDFTFHGGLSRLSAAKYSRIS